MNSVISQAVSVAITWQAQWIGRPGPSLTNWQGKVLPAPLFRREFMLDGRIRQATACICGLGYYELRLNGAKVGNHVLDPVVTQYDKRVRYVAYDVTNQLQEGANAVGVTLGNGWYNCHTPDVWHFDKASWRDYPKLIFQLDITFEDGRHMRLVSGPDWRAGDGPIRFDGLRNGETYDAREERPGWDRPGFDDSAWAKAVIVPGPGGILEPQTAPACRVMETLLPRSVTEVRPGVYVFDIGQNIAGWVQLTAQGEAGTEVVLRYAEKLKDDGDIDQSNINSFIKGGDCQTDRYILKGGGKETWEPKFAYHGFQYVQMTGFPGVPDTDSLQGQVVHTGFETIGTFECSDPMLNRLQTATLWSYRGNFVGIPTDCPHREKNGWTGDAQLAAETGLLNFAATPAYAEWLETLADTQRPSGQFPGIAPSTGWGYNWGSGPAWDSAMILIPWTIYLYTGDLSIVRRHYAVMKRYVDFCTTMATDNTVSFGLGDWCHADRNRMAPAALTSTGYYYRCARVLAAAAELTDRMDDTRIYTKLADRIRDAFNARFYMGEGVYAGGEATAQACALYQGLVPDSEKAAGLGKLVEAVEGSQCRADFGILGAKYIPRVLADNGYAALAYRLIRQPEFPGWIHWLQQGATTLWEDWNGRSSRNHIMFGDVSAWMYNYLAGIAPDEANPGFSTIFLRPNPVPELDWVKVSYRSAHGLICSEWQRSTEGITYTIEIPEGIPGHILLPGARVNTVTADGLPLTGSTNMAVAVDARGLCVSVPSGKHVFQTLLDGSPVRE